MDAKTSAAVRGCAAASPAMPLDPSGEAGGFGPRVPDSGTVTDVDAAGGDSTGLTLPATLLA